MRKKQRLAAIIIVAIVSLSMIGSTFVLFFSSDSTAGNSNSTAANSIEAQIQSLQGQVDALNQAINTNPQDMNIRLSLANAYYDLGMVQSNSSDSASQVQATATLKQAVTAYQEVLKTKKDDVNIMVDMATAAYFSGDDTLAEATFKQVLTIKPDFFNGLLNYGYFLMNGKGDYLGAIAEFNKALNTNPSPTDAERVKSLISDAQEKLNTQFETNSASPSTGK